MRYILFESSISTSYIEMSPRALNMTLKVTLNIYQNNDNLPHNAHIIHHATTGVGQGRNAHGQRDTRAKKWRYHIPRLPVWPTLPKKRQSIKLLAHDHRQKYAAPGSFVQMRENTVLVATLQLQTMQRISNRA